MHTAEEDTTLTENEESQLVSVVNRSKYSGRVRVGTHLIDWEESPGGEIRFNCDALRQELSPFKFGPLGRLGLDKTTELNLINKILAHYRPHALPDGQGYYAAAAVVTDDGRLFVEVNNEKYITEAYSGRGCAETSSHRNAQKTLGTENIQYARVYLASGMAKKLENGKLRDREPGHIACLCGDCRRNFRDHTHDGTEFIMIPTNDGEKELSRREGVYSAEKIGENEAWVIDYTTMYPFPKQEFVPTKFNDSIRAGYFSVTDSHCDDARFALETPLTRSIPAPDASGNVSIPHDVLAKLLGVYRHPDTELVALGHEPSLENINKNLRSLVRRAYQEHAVGLTGDRNIEITAVIVKTQTGKFYPGVLVDGEAWIPSKPNEMPTTLSNAYNHIGITDVYTMHFDNRQLIEEMSTAENSDKKVFTVQYPDPAALGRLIKNTKSSISPKVTMFPVNDGTLGEDELHELGTTFDAREAFGPAFANPKQQTRSIIH